MINSNTYTNHLVNEGSPYLLMHVHNPVDWYAWNDEAWTKARQEDKLVVISIGYAACHWCHVMEHESFSDPEVATIMNEHFVSVKVDREERPDVDQVYMEVAQRLTGRGGWPLNVIALSDGKPVFAGSYYTKSQWIFLLQQLNHLYRSSRDEINEMANGITQDINVNSLVGFHSDQLSDFQINDLHQIVDEWMSLFDHTYGGLNAAPKFPMPCVYDFLLSYYAIKNDVKILDIVTLTLDQMAMGGIYDQIGGGFARYSTDVYWRVPHFEKMLYDNAQLVSLYAKAFQMSGNPLYKQVIEDTLRFVTAELTSSEYGFYSSLDADSEGEEGKYYAWTMDDLAGLSPAEVQLIKDYFDVSEQGNWEHGKNVLYRKTDDQTFCTEHGLDILQFSEQLTEVKRKLLHIRNQRSKPALDNKILTSWNALMIEGYIDAYKAIGNHEYLETAVRNARFIADNSTTADGKLFRSFMNGKPSIDAFLDDYAFTIKAFLLLYQVTFDKYWLFKASELAQYTILHFYSNEFGLFHYTSDVSEKLIKRNYELFDGVVPSSNSIMAENLYILGEIFLNDDYQKMARQLLVQLADKLPETGPYGASWLKLMIWFIIPPSIIAVVGPDCVAESLELQRMFLPNILIIGGVDEKDIPYLTHKSVEGKTTFYLCQNRTCGLPVHSVRELIAQINNK